MASYEVDITSKDFSPSRDLSVTNLSVGHGQKLTLDDLYEDGTVDQVYQAKARILNNSIQEIGMGKYQIYLFCCAGFGWFAVWPLITGLILTPVINEFKFDGPFLSLAANIGLFVGAVIWSFGCDIWGRRWSFNLTLLIAGVFGLAAGGSQNFVTLASLIATLGVGVGGNLPVDSAVFLDLVPGTHQYLLTVMSVWWCLGQLVVSLLAWPLIANFSCASSTNCTRSENMGWRYLLFILGALTLLLWGIRFFVFKLFESPRFLVGIGKDAEAVEVIRMLAEYNSKTSNLTVDQLKAWFFNVSLDLSMGFLPFLLESRGNAYGDGSLYITYRNTFILSVIGVPGAFLAGWAVELPYIGRKGTLAISSGLTGAFLFATTTARSSNALLGWNCGYTFFSNIMYGVLYAISPEVFPAKDRGTGNGLVFSATRVFSILAPIIALYANLETATPVYISGALIILAGQLSRLWADHRGFGAWSFLTAAFFVEAIVWGFPTSFGVFLDAYLNDTKYASQPKASSLLPLIGPVSTGIIYCSGPFITPVITRYPYHKRTSMYVGTILCWTSLFAASYTTQVIKLVALQGALYAIGGSLLYIPCISYLSEWFHHKRGFANGVVFAGTAVGGILLPLILPPSISSYGPPKTLRILSIAIALLIVPLLPLIKGRLPESRIRAMGPTPRGRGNAEWTKSISFWILVLANTFQGFGYFVPIVWLPTFASDLNLNSSTSSIALALLNCGSVIGRLATGYLSDKINPWFLGLSILASTSAATFILWGVLSYDLAGLLSFSLAYGILASGWTSTWNGFTKPLSPNDPNLSTTLFGVLLFSRGIGNIFSTPISSALTSLHSNSTTSSFTHTSNHLGFDVGGGKFEKMIVDTT
ncbi:sugar transporter [Lentinula edodes]|uniref:Sugar transporter n=1 Tax=Lentinula edodes TaxID=5353 RepID=A0A1Q3ECB1_LENED|nr:sugar transporter [Lentinula edodes]